MANKTAGITVYLMEELTDARLRCEQLKRYVDQAVSLVSQSDQKAHIHEVAGDLLYGIPDALFRLDKALDATALAASRLDYEELKQELRPEKVNELEQVLQDVRIRHFDRRAPEGNTMRKLATGTDVATALRRVAAAIEADPNPSAAKIANTLAHIVADMGTPTAEEALRARFEKDKPADPTENMSEDDASKWRVEHLKNKDNFTDKEAASGDPRWIVAKYPGTDMEGKNFKKGDMVLYYPRDKRILSGEKAKAEWRKFQTEVEDEDVYNGKYARFEEGKPADPTENMSESDAKEWKAENEEHKDNFKAAGGDDLLRSISRGDRVTIVTPQGQQVTGKAVMKGPAGWVLNMGGAHGRPGVATPDNIVKVKKASEEHEARFEEGKPADPTENMDSEDAKSWKDMNEEHADQFKA